MRYHNITTDDMLNGDGLRTVLWVAGCEHRCRGCHNPITWDVDGGVPFDEAAEQELFEKLSADYISGITFSGGDPMFQPEGFAELAEAVKRETGKNIWCYTGYKFERLRHDRRQAELLQYIDVLVDGPYVEFLRDRDALFRGSRNQRLIDVQASLREGEVVLYAQ